MFCIVFDLAMVVISSRLARVCLKTAFAELNERLPDVANVIYEHDTTGMAEPFHAIESRLKNVFVDAVQKDRIQENANILIGPIPLEKTCYIKMQDQHWIRESIGFLAAMAGITLGKQMPEVVGAAVYDKTGNGHLGIIGFPVPILKGNVEVIKSIREKLCEPEFSDLTVVDFSDHIHLIEAVFRGYDNLNI